MKAETFIALGLMLVFIGIGAQMASFENNAILGGALSAAGAVLLLRGYMINKNPEKLKKDERSKKVSAWAASYSWFVTVLALVALFWANRFGIITLDTELTIGSTYIIMVSTIVLFKLYFNSKGDVE